MTFTPTRFVIVDAQGQPTGPATTQSLERAETIRQEAERISGQERQLRVIVGSLRVPGSVAEDLHSDIAIENNHQPTLRLAAQVPIRGGYLTGMQRIEDILNLAGVADFVAERMDERGEYSIEREDVGARSAARAAARCRRSAQALVS